MTESYLTTDIVVIIALAVTLVLVGVGAFFIHYYWTKIGVSEIWNTAKWSSIRSSIYRTVSRFNRANRNKATVDSPYALSPTRTKNVDDFHSPDQFQNRKSIPVITSYVLPIKQYSTAPDINILSPESSSNNPISSSYGTKIGQPIENTTIYNIHEYDNEYDPSSIHEQRQRF